MGEHADEYATHLETSNSTVARLQVTDARETHGGNPAFSGERCKAPGCVGVKPDNSAAGLLPAGGFFAEVHYHVRPTCPVCDRSVYGGLQ